MIDVVDGEVPDTEDQQVRADIKRVDLRKTTGSPGMDHVGQPPCENGESKHSGCDDEPERHRDHFQFNKQEGAGALVRTMEYSPGWKRINHELTQQIVLKSGLALIQ